MADHPEPAPPLGTIERIRKRSIWAVALFATSVAPAIVGAGLLNASTNQVNIATPMAFGFWLLGVLFALWAAIPTLRYWDHLPSTIRWFGALPMLGASFFFCVVLIGVLL